MAAVAGAVHLGDDHAGLPAGQPHPRELAATYRPSQASVSRAIAAITPLQDRALRPFVPPADELTPGGQYLVDGTLLPCWSWRDHPELYSSKHKTTGLNVQIAGTLDGELIWVSDPVDGSRHDVTCLDASGALTGSTPATGPATRATSAAAWPPPTDARSTRSGQRSPLSPGFISG